MSGDWKGRDDRGSLLILHLVARVTLFLGRPVGRVLLYPICFYFLLFSRGEHVHSRRFLERALGRRATWRDIFRHYRTFGMTLLDRLFLLAGRHHLFRLEKHGREAMYTLLQQGRGLLLLGAHLGSFELARSFGEASSGVPVNMMMHDNQMQKINRVIASLGLREHMRIIPIGGLDALLAAHERVEQGEMIGMLADRVVSAERAVRVPFLGKEALFPAGPILLANALKVPVVLFFGLYQGGNRYVEHFEVFADQIVLGRATRQADLEVWVRRYVQRLEYFSRLAPYNWFNFFDFWGEHPPAAPAPAAERASSRHA